MRSGRGRITINNAVDARGLLHRQIFVDRDIYRQELEQIYGRCWLYIGHESQVAKPNDFTATRMGEDPVLFTRDSKGKLHAFLNMCRHRGNRVCRTDRGNTQSFMCTYHGWTFASDGKLVGVPGYKEAYFEELDRSQWGLVEAAQISSYKGMVFATWDENAPSLLDYLGDMAWYLDMSLDNSAGGSEVFNGTQKAVLPCNWKYPCDNNGGDNYHSPITHRGSDIVKETFATKPQPPPNYYVRGRNRTVHAGNGHCMVTFGSGSPIDINQTDPIPTNPTDKYRRQLISEAVDRLGGLRVGYGGLRTPT
ncbi:MAG: aromatic ring-hydroxylating dioxygenase subunit alpha, partial [Dehalococcoidia bacterium]|nr:aromatic ring-hydroxylating dioxygenase subunit alpha [Dehalococcoidia bacterium]